MKKFRRIIINTIDDKTNSYVYWLKYIFHQLDQQAQTSSNEIAMLDFVRCFWSTVWDNVIEVKQNPMGNGTVVETHQQDIHEFLCKLLIDLTEKINSDFRQDFENLFTCMLHSEIVCDTCHGNPSERHEMTTNIQLPIAHDDDIMDAFNTKYGTAEELKE